MRWPWSRAAVDDHVLHFAVAREHTLVMFGVAGHQVLLTTRLSPTEARRLALCLSAAADDADDEATADP